MKALLVLACLLAITVPFEASGSRSGSNERKYKGHYRPQPFPFYPLNPYYPPRFPPPNSGPVGYPFPQFFYYYVPIPRPATPATTTATTATTTPMTTTTTTAKTTTTTGPTPVS